MSAKLAKSYDIIIIGGGAAGFFAASNVKGLDSVLILEKGRMPLSKVRISGGGRCNVTYACFDPWQLISYYPRGSQELKSAFTRFQPWDVMNWFENRGVKLKIEADGRVFPTTDNSIAIVNCLLESASALGAECWCQTKVHRIALAKENSGNRFDVAISRHTTTDQEEGKSISQEEKWLSAKNILLATGGSPQGHRFAKQLGHTIITPVPSLFTFEIHDPRLDGLAGISFPQVKVRLLPLEGNKEICEQEGPILITHWGISGPVVLRCSAWGARWLHEQKYHARMQINWLYPTSLEQTLDMLHAYKAETENRRRTVLVHYPFPGLPLRMWQSLVRYTHIDENEQWANLSKRGILQLAQSLCNGKYAITGKGVFKDEFVTCGGVHLAEVDFRTMQSRLIPGLYFAGEILNIDGLTGGFNFQNAWTTAYIASQGICA